MDKNTCIQAWLKLHIELETDTDVHDGDSREVKADKYW